MQIHRDACLLHEVTTAEDCRYFLGGAMFDKQGRAIATNGHVLLRFKGRSDVVSDGDADVILLKEDLKIALDSTSKKHAEIEVAPNGTHVTLTTTNGRRTVTIDATKVAGDFPNTQRVMDIREREQVAEVVLNSHYLELLGKITRQLGAKFVVFTFHKGELHDTPVFLSAECENGTLDGAVMPMKR